MTCKIINAEKGIVKVTPKRKKVAIIGTSSSRIYAPFEDDSWECWGLNEIDQDRAERYFEIHELKASSKEEIEWLKECEVPIYMCKTHKKIPMSVKYPLVNICGKLECNLYFTCTFAYQIALAIYEGFEEIGLWGANLPAGSPREKLVETACVEYWLGFAMGRGIKIFIPTMDSLLYHKHYYGYDYNEEITYVNRVVATLYGRICADMYLRSL